MNDTFRMGGFERVSDLNPEIDESWYREGLAREQPVERLAFE
jgi:hypothetical protein